MSDEAVDVPSGTSLEPPSGAELAAVMAAVEASWPRPVVAVESGDDTPAWRFSGRPWALPLVARRRRPYLS